MSDTSPTIKGRGTGSNPVNRFEPIHHEVDPELPPEERPAPQTTFYRDTSRSILSHNDSPDLGFEYSLNPYRGCEHGCIYCYARPYHEYLGFSLGLDFETKIMVKEDAPKLLRQALMSPRWRPQTIVLSGITDPYQPIERDMQLTRRCLEVLAEFRQPVSIITKNHLVLRDLDILQALNAYQAVKVNLSITTLDRSLRHVLEPRTSVPEKRLDAVRTLSRAGIPVGVMMAPVIPGLTEHEIPKLVQAAADAGARTINYLILRLPYQVKDMFVEWLAVHFPDRKDKILNRIRSMRGGKLNDPRFGKRFIGEGVYADHIRDLFHVARQKAGLSADHPPLSTAAFCRPGAQLQLFDDLYLK